MMMSTSIRSAKEVFDKYDADKSGKICFDEFRNMLPDLGIHLTAPKQLEYFCLCDKDGNGQIDFEELKIALFVCDTEESNPVGFNPGGILRPKDAFNMFDKDSNGKLDEDEFFFVLDYLNIKIDDGVHEKMFTKYDTDRSGFVEYPEFKRAWLRLANTKKELLERGVEIPTLATKVQMIVMLETIIGEEEKHEAETITAAKRWRKEQERLRHLKVYVQEAEMQAEKELCSALDAAGQVYVFGNGTLDQFCKQPRKDLSTPFFNHIGCDLLQTLWAVRISKDGVPYHVSDALDTDEPRYYAKQGDDTGLSSFKGLNAQQNTVWLWGRNPLDIAVSDCVMVARCGECAIYAWGGHDLWWHELEADSKWQSTYRGEMTPRSRDLVECSPSVHLSPESSLIIETPQQLADMNSTAEDTLLQEKLKSILKYYDKWEIPNEALNLLDYTKDCIRSRIKREHLAESLQLRGKSRKGSTKLQMIDLLYSDILLEYKMLGESCHNFLRELDKEIVEQKRKKKLKLAKRLEIQFKNQWQPLKQAQVNDLGNAVKKQHLKNSKYKDDMNQSYLAWIERMKEQKYQDIDGLFTVTGITSRAPPRPLRTTSSKCKEIEAGANHIGILNNEGVLFMWGSNSIGRLGGTSDLNAAKRGQQRTLIAVDLPNEKKISTFSCGYSHTVAACDDGELYVWGSASVGKLGLGDISILHAFYCQTPVQLIMPHCRRIRVVSCGASHTACVGDSGELYVWGNGNGGRLGLGCDRLCDQIEPVLVESLAKECVVGVSCGNSQTLVVTKVFESVSMINNCAVTSVSGGNLFVAGPRGVLGSQCYSFEPYKYFMSDHQRIDQQPIEQISAGFSHQSAVSINGELFTWGDNTDGCCCHQTEKHFIKSPTLVKSLYKKGTDLAKDKSRHCSPPYGHQPFYEIDLGDTATIAEIKLWNTMKAPNNPAVNKATFNDRIFPSWIMVSQVAFPECAGEGGLQEALKVSVAKKRLTQNKHESLWHPPRGTKGRFVRFQLEELNLLEFEKLEVFGSFGTDKSVGKVSSAKCGKRVTGVIIKATNILEDLVIAYQRAVAADPYNAKILRQLDIYQPIYNNETEVTKQNKGNCSLFKVGCMLCVGTTLCPLCKFKNDFRNAFDSLEMERVEGEEIFLKDLVDTVMMGEKRSRSASP